ncbi:hypothetical protein ACFL7D_11030 [candidate division KSB1 bacterium]
MKRYILKASSILILFLASSVTLFAQAPVPPPAPVGTIPWGNPGIYGIVLLFVTIYKILKYKKKRHNSP